MMTAQLERHDIPMLKEVMHYAHSNPIVLTQSMINQQACHYEFK